MTEFAVILAAGASRRLGRLKQLVERDGETLVARAVRVAREAGLEPLVVTGREAEAIEALVDARIVYNPRWREGMGSSIAAAMAQIGAVDSVTIVTCDQYRVGPAELVALRAALGDNDAAAAQYAGVLGVPALFAVAAFPRLAALGGDSGARDLLRNGELRVVAVPMPEAAIDLDDGEDMEVFDG